MTSNLPVTEQVRSPWSTTPIWCKMLIFPLYVNSPRKNKEAWKKQKRWALCSQTFPSRVGFSSRQACQVFLTTPRFLRYLIFLWVCQSSQRLRKKVSWNESSHRIWKDIEVSANWIEGVTEFLLLLLCVFFFFYFTIQHPQWLWRRHSLSHSDSWSRPSGGISICSYFCESGEQREGNECCGRKGHMVSSYSGCSF